MRSILLVGFLLLSLVGCSTTGGVSDMSEGSMDRALYQVQRGLLQGFTIVGRYYDKERDTHWSLASIAEKGAT